MTKTHTYCDICHTQIPSPIHVGVTYFAIDIHVTIDATKEGFGINGWHKRVELCAECWPKSRLKVVGEAHQEIVDFMEKPAETPS